MRNCIQICFLLHGHTERGIPYCHICLARHNSLTCLNTHQICRIVQRSKVKALSDHSLHIIIHHDGLTVGGSSVKHTMSDSSDFIRAFHHAVFRILKRLQNQSDCHLMIRHRLLCDIFILSGRLMGQLRAFNTDSLTQTFCYYTLVVHID